MTNSFYICLIPKWILTFQPTLAEYALLIFIFIIKLMQEVIYKGEAYHKKLVLGKIVNYSIIISLGLIALNFVIIEIPGVDLEGSIFFDIVLYTGLFFVIVLRLVDLVRTAQYKMPGQVTFTITFTTIFIEADGIMIKLDDIIKFKFFLDEVKRSESFYGNNRLEIKTSDYNYEFGLILTEKEDIKKIESLIEDLKGKGVNVDYRRRISL